MIPVEKPAIISTLGGDLETQEFTVQVDDKAFSLLFDGLYSDKEQSVLSYARYDGSSHAMVVLNLTPVPRKSYRLGAPAMGTYHVVLNSDATAFGGSGYVVADTAEAELVPYHGFPQSLTVSLPPLSILVLLPAEQPEARAVIDGLQADVVTIALAYDIDAIAAKGEKALVFVDPVSQHTGGRKYSFGANGQFGLFLRCYARNGRHDFVLGNRLAGPNTFLDCIAAEASSAALTSAAEASWKAGSMIALLAGLCAWKVVPPGWPGLPAMRLRPWRDMDG